MDIALETDHNTELDTYIEMIQGKTAALISLCTTLSGVITRQTESVLESLSEFGKSLGMAFQMQDDYLGIWGIPKITGKSVLSDLRTKKKTLPVLYGLQNCQEFKTSWEKDNPTSEQIAHMAEILTSCGAMSYVKDQTTDHTNRAFEILKNIFGASKNKNIYVDALFDLCEMLLIRKA